uniref:phytanoyl-CoA dioxygenase domain-containing protein 1-like n=1 Tax=Styela clava TaxID=7725 RepID=UPI0019393C08|nr:phytanoyl-CoA dioxygenase domain-containing protein 1-like [Styela clava]
MEQYSEESLIQNKAPLTGKFGIPDWSTVHSDSGGLGKKPSNIEEWKRFMFNKEQIAEFHRNGYIANIKVLNETQCDKLLEEYQKVMKLEEDSAERALFYEYHSNQSKDPNNVLMHALGHWRVSQYFHDLVFCPAMTVPTAQLLSNIDEEFCKVRFWHDQLFAKPAKYGGVVAWHQDYSYWTKTQPMRHMTVHIALEDQTLENGCIQYVPGSHNWTRDGKPLPVTDFNFGDMESIQVLQLNQTNLTANWMHEMLLPT